MAGTRWHTWAGRTVALAIAFVVWLYAVTERTYTREIWVPLFVHDPVATVGAQGVVVANPVPESVHIRIAGRGRDLLRVGRDSYAVHLRPNGLPGTTRTYELTADMVEARDDVRPAVESVLEPREVEITLDWRLQRRIPVRARVEVEPAEPYVVVGEMQVEPLTVEISGPSVQIGKISQVVTDSVSLRDVREDVDEYVAVLPPKGFRCRIDPARVKVHAAVQILAQDDIQQVPVAVRNDSMGRYRVEPARVRVRVKGGIDVIAGLDPETDIGLYVDASGNHDKPLPVLHGETPLFEVVQIVPSHVHLIER